MNEFLNIATYVCLALCGLFFVLSIVLFFVFNIPLIFNIRTGRAKKKTIEEMQKANSQTGRLRQNGKTLTSRLDEGFKAPSSVPPQVAAQMAMQMQQQAEQNTTFTVQSVNRVSTDGTEMTGALPNQAPAAAAQTAFNVGAAAAVAETSLLSEAGETSVLDNSSETTVLSGGMNSSEFQILQKIIHIHTAKA